MKNEVLNAIFQRRSIRKFEEEQIKNNELEMIIEAGVFAPSSMNQQNWHFTVIQDKNLIDEISLNSKKHILDSPNEHIRSYGTNESLHIFYNAPTIIVVSEEINTMSAETNCAAAIQNMLLAAQSLGIGSCWIGLSRYLFHSVQKDEYFKKLGIPDNFQPNYSIAFGYPKSNPNSYPERRIGTVNYVR